VSLGECHGSVYGLAGSADSTGGTQVDHTNTPPERTLLWLHLAEALYKSSFLHKKSFKFHSALVFWGSPHVAFSRE
jgi:hypothetical protein